MLNYSITGSSNSSSPAENATCAMQHVEVQRLLLDVAASPRCRAYVEVALRGSGISPNDMLSNGALRLEDGRYWLNFGLLTRADQEAVVKAADVYSQRLADAVLLQRARIETILRSYGAGAADPRVVAFVVLGCFSLDWDGLGFATSHGYRAAPPRRKGGQFFFMAEERGGPPLKQVYWGSSSSSNGNYAFLSFGDHFSPRTSLLALDRDSPAELRAIIPRDLGRLAGAVMLALRGGPLAAEQLAQVAGRPRAEVEALLAGLTAFGYVRKDGERYRAAIPVLAIRDQEMVTGLLRIGREATARWFAGNYADFQVAMRDISPVRNRVPFTVAFDQLWHYLFGTANRKLVEAGLFADPYAPDSPSQGYVNAVYTKDLRLQSGLAP